MMDKALLSAGRMAVLFDVPERTLQRILAQKGIENTRGQGYDFNASVRAIITHYRLKAESLDNAVAADRARQQRAAADREELSLAKDLSLVVPTEDAQRCWENGFVQYRLLIERDQSLSEEQKKQVLELLTQVTLKENGSDE